MVLIEQGKPGSRNQPKRGRNSPNTGPSSPPTELATPPHDPNAERAILGACLLGQPDLVTQARQLLPEGHDWFYNPLHARIWHLICTLTDRDITPDPITAADHARSNGEPWRHPDDTIYLHHLYENAPLTPQLAHHCHIVARHETSRRLDLLAIRMRQAVATGDHPRLLEHAATLRDNIDQVLGDVHDQSDGLPVLSIRELRAQVAANPVNYLLKPVWPGDAYGVIAAEDKAGKSWAVIDMGLAVAAGGVWMHQFDCLDPGPVLLFAGEGGGRNLLRRIDAVARFYDIDGDALDFEICERVPHLTNVDHLAVVARYLERRPRRLVIVDPLYLAARGANGADLYAMGEHLEGIQHVCQQAGSALVVVTHFNKTGIEKKGKARITGVGPGAWGRVLATAAVESRESYNSRTTVTLNWDFVGGEIPDSEMYLRRRVWADDPDDLMSPLHYEIERVEESELKVQDGRAPAHARILALLRAADRPMTVRELGDRLADDGHPLKARTIQEALEKLGELIDSREIDGRGKREYWIAGREIR